MEWEEKESPTGEVAGEKMATYPPAWIKYCFGPGHLWLGFIVIGEAPSLFIYNVIISPSL